MIDIRFIPTVALVAMRSVLQQTWENLHAVVDRNGSAIFACKNAIDAIDRELYEVRSK